MISSSIVAFLVFDLTNQESFDELQRWVEEIKTHANEQTRLVLVGNKSDLSDKRVITKEQGL